MCRLVRTFCSKYSLFFEGKQSRILLAWTRQNWRPNEVRTFACGAALLIGATSYGQDPEKAADATVSATIKAANATADGTEKAVKTAGDAVEKAKDVVEH